MTKQTNKSKVTQKEKKVTPFTQTLNFTDYLRKNPHLRPKKASK